MPYFAVDDGMYDHPKFDMVSDHAVALWTKAGSFCARFLTDGFVCTSRVVRLGYFEAHAEELVQAGLWVRVQDGLQDGFLFHQWAEHQQIKAEVEQQRSKWRETKRQQRSTKPLAKPGLSSVDSIAESNGESDGPIPTHPNPLREKSVLAPPARTRAPNVALDALKAALKAQIPMAPAVSKGNAEKAAGRLREAVAAGLASDLDTAAGDLVRAAIASGGRFPWCLLDANPYQVGKPVPANGYERRLRADEEEGMRADLRAKLSTLEADFALANGSGDELKAERIKRAQDDVRAKLRALKAGG